VAEATRASGAAALEATIAAVEVMCRVGLAVPGRFHARHFHPTSLTSSFAAAVASGRVYGVDEDQLVHALGICGSQAAGIIEYLSEGAWTKRMHPGWGAHGGVIAALLARNGFTGPTRVLEGEHGLYAAFAGGHDPARLDALMATLGKTWELERLTFKPYPCGSIAHPYMDCALKLRTEHAFTPEDIVEVRCRTAAGPLPRLWEPLHAKHRPPNGYAAKFSLPYLLAVMFVRGWAGLADFTDDAVADERVLRVAAPGAHAPGPGRRGCGERAGRRTGRGREERGQDRLVHLAGPAERREGRQAVRGGVSRHPRRRQPDRLPADPPEGPAGNAGGDQERRRRPHLGRRPLRAPQGQEAPAPVPAAGDRQVSGRLQGQGRLLLRAPRHGERHHLQHQGGHRGRRAEDVEGPARSEVEGQARHRASRLQRRHLHPSARARASVAL